jgi:putative cell wall-binding protein
MIAAPALTGRYWWVALGVICAVLAGALAAPPSAQAAGTGSVSGTVTGSVPEGWDSLVTVELQGLLGGTVASTTADPVTGAYTLTAAPGTYKLFFHYTGAGNFLSRFYGIGEGLTRASGYGVPIVDGATAAVSISLSQGGVISGTASGPDGVVPTAVVEAAYQWPYVSLNSLRLAFDSATGQYTIDRLETANVEVSVGAGFGWRDYHAPPVPAVVGASTTLDLSLENASGIRGTVTGTEGASIYVILFKDGVQFDSKSTSGAFEFNDIGAGTFTVQFGGYWVRQDFITEWWDGASEISAASPITLAEGQTRSGVDAEVIMTPDIRGTVLGAFNEGTLPVPDVSVRLYQLQVNDSWEFIDWSTQTGVDGTFTFYNVEPGTYRIRVDDTYGYGFGTRYWPDSRFVAGAGSIVAVGGEDVDLSPMVLQGDYISIERIAGADRFSTAVKSTQVAFPASSAPLNVPVVYIANGYNYPDALSAGPAAVMQDGALLIVEPDAIPPVVWAELLRLNPQRIVVAGGTGVVSPAVFSRLQANFPNVTRVPGADRYATSRLIAGAFHAPVSEVFIANGNNFPDALAAGPAAALYGAPVILVDGAASAIDSATVNLITSLGATTVHVIGGTGSVSQGIETSLLSSFTVDRIAGPSRYETALAINQRFFVDESEYAFLATGADFPDALGGGALAGRLGAPLYLGVPECFPPSVAYDVLFLNVREVRLIGGTGVLGAAVENGELCSS